MKADDGERGDGLVELAIAIFVLLLVLGAVVHFVAAGFAVSTRTQVVEQATTAAYSALDSSEALGCGVATGSESGSTLSQLASACHGTLGNASWTQAEGDATYRVTETTSWIAVGSTVPPGDCNAFANLTPTGLTTQVLMQWATGSTAFRRAVSTLVPVPPDALAYHDASLGRSSSRARRPLRSIWPAACSSPTRRSTGASGSRISPPARTGCRPPVARPRP